MTSVMTLSVIDVNSQRLPDRLTLPLTAAGLLLSILFQWGNPAMRLAAAVVGYALMYAIALGYERLRQRPRLGLGDAKLFAAAGAWLGFDGLPTARHGFQVNAHLS
jgi:leader peptidase (prepilin peptidase) / N-methyltransferase